MKYLFVLLACIQLSVQLPHPNLSSFVSRSHTLSPYTSSLKRSVDHASKKLGSRQTQTEGSGTIVDNKRQKFLLPITFGSQTLDAELDTGSSDTWLIQTGFKCYDTFNSATEEFTGPESPSTCNFGPTYSPGDDFHVVDGVYQFSCYGQSGENSERCVYGPMGTTSVGLAGLTIPEQIVGAPDESSYPAQGLAEQSGIIGLAFPGLTSAYNASTSTGLPYNSIMETIFEVDTFTPPLAKQFALAISRDDSSSGNGGIFSIGGIPDLTDPAVNVSSTTPTSAPFQIFSAFSTTEYTFYSILVDGFVADGSTTGAGTQIIIDSGANSFQVPPATADEVNSLWSSPVADDGTLPCDAVLTKPFGVTIGGATYYVQSKDLLGETDGSCYSLVAAGDGGQYLVGDPLLRNVLAVYDWGDQVMSFYPRMYYKS